MFAVAQQIVHQQLFGKRFKAFGQLGEKHTEVFQHFGPGQWFACLFDADPCTIDQVQRAVVAQQVVQVQVLLPQAFEVHLADGRQRLSQHRLLLVCQHRQVLHRTPGFAEALRAVQKLKQ